jgi:hypothetical protein
MDDRRYTVEQLLELAHKYRALHIKCGPLEVQLAPNAFGVAEQNIPGSPIGLESGAPTDSELMFYSSGLEYDETAPDHDDRGPQ